MANGAETTHWRLQRLEADARDREQRLRGIETVIARIPDLERNVEANMNRLRDELREDLGDIKGDCTKTRSWVETQIKEAKEEEKHKESLSLKQLGVIVAAGAVVVAALIQLVGVFVQAGAH